MIRRLAVAATALLLLASCGPRPIEARPALWVVRDADTEIWLLGTIHALPPNVRWETPAITQAIDAADTLVTEIPADDPAWAATRFTRLASAPGLPPIAARVTPGLRPRVGAAVAASGATAEALGGLRSWAAAVTIAAGPLRAAGASADHGVEAVLARRFAGRRHAALETRNGQLAVFNALPEAAQRVLLARAIDDPGGYARTLAAWRGGDVGALAASFAPAFRGAPVLREMLVTRRNARWAGWIAGRMARPGRVLIAVGAGHLVGAESVVAMLEARGLAVERVE